jgi:hypothetical protein
MKRRHPLPPAAPAAYRIRVAGCLNPGWGDWFNGLSLAEAQAAGESPETILTGVVPDQPALRGILNKLWDLNLTLLAVERLAVPQESEPDRERHASA